MEGIGEVLKVAELLALVECVKFAVHIQQLKDEMRLPIRGPIVVEQDNNSTILLGEGEGSAKRSRHLIPKIAYVRDLVRLGKLKLTYVPTNAICADVLTKPKHGKAFEDARAILVVEPHV